MLTAVPDTVPGTAVQTEVQHSSSRKTCTYSSSDILRIILQGCLSQLSTLLREPFEVQQAVQQTTEYQTTDNVCRIYRALQSRGRQYSSTAQQFDARLSVPAAVQY